MPFTLTKPYPQLWSLDAGVAMVVTDLHGDWDAYQRYRDRFVDLKAKGHADCLIFTGDLIHRQSPTVRDHSLEIVLDVLALQATYGEAIIYLCGNHELPHIYGFGLSKGTTEYTPGFEAALSQSPHRSAVVGLFYTLPFYVRTAAGVSLTHAGASEVMTDAQNTFKLFRLSHREQLSQADALLAARDIAGLRRIYARLSQAESYDALARHYLAVTGPDDPRYNDLLRGLFLITSADYRLLHSALFTRCEQEYGVADYSTMLVAMLQHLSVEYVPQRVLVAGHLTIPNGYQVIAERHLRLASACHATPREAGLYLLFDTARPIEGTADLLLGLQSVCQAV
jgi:Icc-related predicted phosphoesterase